MAQIAVPPFALKGLGRTTTYLERIVCVSFRKSSRTSPEYKWTALDTSLFLSFLTFRLVKRTLALLSVVLVSTIWAVAPSSSNITTSRFDKCNQGRWQSSDLKERTRWLLEFSCKVDRCCGALDNKGCVSSLGDTTCSCGCTNGSLCYDKTGAKWRPKIWT